MLQTADASEPRARVLVIDDDVSQLDLLQRVLTREGYAVEVREDPVDGMHVLGTTLVDVVLLDLHFPDAHGLDLLEEAFRTRPDVPVVMLTVEAEIATVVRAIHAGAFDYLAKPVDLSRLLATMESALRVRAEALARRERERDAGGGSGGYPGLIGNSAAMRDIKRTLDRVVHSDVTVLIEGESGTGKEVVARALHDGGPRRSGPFVVVNCGAIPDHLVEGELFGHERGAFTGAIERRIGRFEEAHTGTVFLDEVGELQLQHQVRLLRVLQERAIRRLGGRAEIDVDVRVIAATNQRLRDMLVARTFREDLYYRLAVVELRLPPLRERPGDALALARHHVRRLCDGREGPELALSPGAVRLIETWSWPGNVRELFNAVECAVVLCRGDVIEPSDFPARIVDAPPTALEPSSTSGATPRLVDVERRAIEDAIAACGGNLSEVVRRLGMPRSTLYRRLRAYGLR